MRPVRRLFQLLAGEGVDEQVGFEKEAEHQRTMWRARHVLVAARTPHVVAGAHFAFGIDDGAFQHVGLFDLDMLMQRQFGAGLQRNRAVNKPDSLSCISTFISMPSTCVGFQGNSSTFRKREAKGGSALAAGQPGVSRAMMSPSQNSLWKINEESCY